MKFKNKEEFEKYIDILTNPPKVLRFIFKVLVFISGWRIKKKLKKEKERKTTHTK